MRDALDVRSSTPRPPTDTKCGDADGAVLVVLEDLTGR
jgi:hypothetical protein